MRQYLILIFLMGMIFFTRPTGIVVILGAIAFLLKYYESFLSGNLVVKLPALGVLLIGGSFFAILMLDKWDFTDQYKLGNIVTYMNTTEGTALYKESLRMDTNDLKFAADDDPVIKKILYFVIFNPIHFFVSAVLKVWYLLSGVRPYYSNLHNLYTGTWTIIIYFLAYSGIRKSFSSSLNTFNIVVIVANCGLIALSTVDWDNRFYIPMEPSFVLLAGGGAVSVLKSCKRYVAVFRSSHD